ncbi:hypothetical protein Tco_0975062 [Tanacetum coccineum]|uniref:DUF4283 domain-containing protein n=1 Tax=Tanacetum coccineum TaxID=301880 RepID=A0ABQ5EDA7_9ASTR
MNGTTYRYVLCYQLGFLLFSISKPCSTCSMVFTGDIYGDHTASCAVIVEINANKGYKDIIEIQYVDAQKVKKRAKTVQVEYQWKPISCNHCKMFGHGLIECKNMPKTEAYIKMKRSERKEKTDLAGFEVVKNKKICNYIDNLKKKSVEVQYRPKVNNTKNAQKEKVHSAEMDEETGEKVDNVQNTEVKKSDKSKDVAEGSDVSLCGVYFMIQVLNLYFADFTKNNTLTGSVPDRW